MWTKTHKVVKLLLPKLVWDIPTIEKTVYLTFDDGPVPEITEWVLEQLSGYQAQATFFCIGDNIRKNGDVFELLRQSGHKIGNHTFNHRNGWKTRNEEYFENVHQCEILLADANIEDKLFRPPYGKIKPSQSRKLRKMGYKIIMWDIISFDFSQSVSAEKCLENVLENVEPGSIIVFHDSVKAFNNLKYVLPKTLAYLKENGYTCAAVN
ncbi:MAG TPA: polysaccharide deacetylase family protein [Flavobacterium sp.]